MIRREAGSLGFKPGFSIFDAEDARALIKELMLKDGELDSDHLNSVQHQISNWKNDLVEPEQALALAESPGEQMIALVYQRYNQALRAYNAVDFDRSEERRGGKECRARVAGETQAATRE